MKNSKDNRIVKFRDHVGELTCTYRRTGVPRAKVKSSIDAAHFIRPFYDEIMDDHEEAKVIHLNNANKIVDIQHLSSGSDIGTIIPIKFVLRNLLIGQNSACIIVHNHPSGNLTPSKADIEITNKLSQACKIMDLKLLDHIIITRDSYYSFADNGKM